MKSAFHYWVDVIGVAAGETLDFVRKKAATGIVIGVITLALELAFAARTSADVWRSLVYTLSALGLLTLLVMIGQLLITPVRERAELQKQHSAELVIKDKALTEKQEEIERRQRELAEVRARISQVPILLQAEKGDRDSEHTMAVDVPQTGAGPLRVNVTIAPAIILAVWKTAQSRELEVTLTTCRFQNFQGVTLEPDFSVLRTMKGVETKVDVTEKLIRPIGGKPVDWIKLLAFEQDVHAIVGYKAQSVTGEAHTSFRLRGRINGGKLQLEIENLPNPPSSTSGQ